MSDLSEQQVMLADAAAGGKVEHDEQYRKKIRNPCNRCWERFRRPIGFCSCSKKLKDFR